MTWKAWQRQAVVKQRAEEVAEADFFFLPFADFAAADLAAAVGFEQVLGECCGHPLFYTTPPVDKSSPLYDKGHYHIYIP